MGHAARRTGGGKRQGEGGARQGAAPRQLRCARWARHTIRSPASSTHDRIASGKGGVGKSTTAVNLALGLQAIGLKTGILDADIYGPSQPRLLGLTGRPQVAHGNTLRPMEAYGLRAMSMGFLVDEGTPIIWRGPMVVSALTQMLRDVDWGDLDVLVIDMPPGTGDAAHHGPVCRWRAPLSSRPQDLALIDARKGLSMFRKVDVPVLGIIENMSYFVCPRCGGAHSSDTAAQGTRPRSWASPFGGVPLHGHPRHLRRGPADRRLEPGQRACADYRDIAAKAGATTRRAQVRACAAQPDRAGRALGWLRGGGPFSLSAEMLRVMSPSAEVQGHPRAARHRRESATSRSELKPVGNYAVRIVFDDGHDTGLYAGPTCRRCTRARQALGEIPLRAGAERA